MKINKGNIEKVIKHFKEDNDIKKVQDVYGDNIQEAIDNLGDQDAYCIINKAILFFGNNKTTSSDKAARQIMDDVNNLVNAVYDEPCGSLNIPVVDSAFISDAIEWRLEEPACDLPEDELKLIINKVTSNSKYKQMRKSSKVKEFIMSYAFSPDDYNSFIADKSYIEEVIFGCIDNHKCLSSVVNVAFDIINKLKKENKLGGDK